ncbi:MAG: DUF952 domain-containing protein [Nocardioidaceae bacterium]
MLIFHIAEPDDWQQARADGTYTTSTRGRTLAEEGFLHCSRFEQVTTVLDFAYADVAGPLSLLVVDTEKLDSPLQLDEVPEAGDVYPHIYGPLNVSAVVDELPLSRNSSGVWQLPPMSTI